MKVPAQPPEWDAVFARALETWTLQELMLDPLDDSDYLPWDRVRFKNPPAHFDNEGWWAALKFRRMAQQRVVPLRDITGDNFHYALTDTVLRECEQIAQKASGEIALPELATSQADRNRYVVSSLIEEAITSSQLEGASTSRRVAKQMIRSGRTPVTRSEKMIFNNYLAMQRVDEWRDEEITPDRVLELHRIVTDGTLDDPDEAGRLQQPTDERIAVWGDGDQLLHSPPPAEELVARLEALCEFANGASDGGSYFPPPVRAIVLHFMVGYDHYFADGNGRTARALFYWCMLRNGYWMSEYVTISKILKNAPAKYAGSFLLSEEDGGDLTYFILYQLKVFLRALDELQGYLTRKAQELRMVRTVLDGSYGDFNHRQLALLDRAIHDESSEFTVISHGSSHRVSHETARQDLRDLESRGLLRRTKRGKAFVWVPTPGLSGRLGSPQP